MNQQNKSTESTNNRLVPNVIRAEYLQGFRDGLAIAFDKVIPRKVITPAEQIFQILQKAEAELSELKSRS